MTTIRALLEAAETMTDEELDAPILLADDDAPIAYELVIDGYLTSGVRLASITPLYMEVRYPQDEDDD